jgi:hypothetical protein
VVFAHHTNCSGKTYATVVERVDTIGEVKEPDVLLADKERELAFPQSHKRLHDPPLRKRGKGQMTISN